MNSSMCPTTSDAETSNNRTGSSSPTTTTTTTTTLNHHHHLSTCSPNEFAQWLVENRFEGDEMSCCTFLLEAISTLPNAQQISDQLTAAAAAAEEEEEEPKEEEGEKSDGPDLGETILIGDSSIIQVSSISPRAKFDVTWFENGIKFVDKKKESFVIPAAAAANDNNGSVVGGVGGVVVNQIIAFPKPEDCSQPSSRKKIAPDLVLLVFQQDSNICFKNKRLKQVCLQLPVELPAWRKKKSEDDDDLLDGLDHTDQWTRVLCASLHLDYATQVARVINPNAPETNSTFWRRRRRYQFASHEDERTSTTTGGLPFVKAYHGVHDGVLYPMKEGLLFFKPPLFVSRRNMHSIACGRGGSDGASRYVDMVVVITTTDDDDDDDDEQQLQQLEFTNIHRSELAVLNNYIHSTLIPAMKKDAAAQEEGEEEEDANKEEEGNPTTVVQDAMLAEDDVVVDGAVVESTTTTEPPNGNKRKASVVARDMTRKTLEGIMEQEDDDDEEDEEEDEYVEGASDDDDDDDDASSEDDSDASGDDNYIIEDKDEDATESEDEEKVQHDPPTKKSRQE